MCKNHDFGLFLCTNQCVNVVGTVAAQHITPYHLNHSKVLRLPPRRHQLDLQLNP